jgi:hypothetical protein
MNLYLRYLLPDEKVWKNASHGTMLERSAARRFNRNNRKWLLLFALRWFLIAVISNIAASASDLVLGSELLTSLFEILSTIAFAAWVTFMAIWLQFELIE